MNRFRIGQPRLHIHTPRAAWSLALMVFLGGGLGAVARTYALNVVGAISAHPQILTVSGINLLGGVVAGAAVAWWGRRHRLQTRRCAFVVPGFCGGFTTFSTFAVQASDQFTEGHLSLGIGALALGLAIGLGAGGLGGVLVRRR